MCKMAANLSNITIAILAGGLGTRLRSAVPGRPKVLAEVHNRPFLTFLLDQLVSADARHVVLCTGHMAGEIHEKLGEAYKSLRLDYSREHEPLGTAGALRLALPYLSSDLVLVMNGDSYINADLNAFLEWFLEKDPAAALILVKVADTRRFGRVASDEGGHVTSFEEKGGNVGPGWISAGVYLLKKKLVETIPSGNKSSLEQDFFPGLISKGLYGYGCEGQFLDIGTPESYAHAKSFFSKISG